MPSQATLYMSWREKEALRVKEKKELRRMVRRSMSTQELSNEMADAAARSRPMSSSYGRPNRNRSRPATPDSIFGANCHRAKGLLPDGNSLSHHDAGSVSHVVSVSMAPASPI